MILQQLAAALAERLEIRIGRVEDRRILRFGLLVRLIVRGVAEVERRPVPVRIGKHEPLVVRDRYREWIRDIAIRPELLAAGHETRIELRAGRRILEAAVHASGRVDLRSREAAVRRLTGLAGQAGGIKRTLTRIVEHAVDDAVFAVAGGERAPMQEPQGCRRKVVDAALENGQRGVEVSGHQPRPVVGRHAGNDAVVIVREPLRFHQPFVAARRAADEVGAFWSFRVERLRDRLRLERGLVVGAIREVDQPFGFLEREPGRIRPARGFMAGVGRGRRIAPPQLVRKLGERDGSGPPAVADAGELAVPLLERQPDLEENLRVARRRNHARDAAERRQVRDRVGRAGGCERAGRHRLSRGNRRIGQLLFGQTGARGARRRLRRCAGAEGAKGHGQQQGQAGRRSHDSTSVGVGSVCAGESRAHGIKTRKGAPSCIHWRALEKCATSKVAAR